MRKVIIDISTASNKTKNKVINKLSWYNDITKQIEYFEGGKLSFRYKKDIEMEKRGYDNPYRLLPEVEDVYTYGSEKSTNVKLIIQSIVSGGAKVVSHDAKKIVVLVDDNDYTNFKRAMDGRGVKFRNG